MYCGNFMVLDIYFCMELEQEICQCSASYYNSNKDEALQCQNLNRMFKNNISWFDEIVVGFDHFKVTQTRLRRIRN